MSKPGGLTQEVASNSDDRKNGDNLNSSCKEDVADKERALGTLRYVLHTLARTIAPSMPFYAEYLYLAVKEESEAESVHLIAWPEAGEVDDVVLGDMSLVREFVTLALEARTKAGAKVRQPLRSLTLNIELLPEYASIIADEVNVKVVLVNASQSERAVLDLTITPELKAEGDVREFMRGVQERRKQAGLEPQDRIELGVQTSGEGQAVLELFREMILRTVGASTIVYTDVTGETITAGEHTFVVALTKL